MKKLLIAAVCCLMLLGSKTIIQASDSAVISGYGYTVNGYICDSYISGSVTGQLSKGSTVTITA